MANRRQGTRRSDPLTPERIIDAAIEILDNDGENALTFRALATKLSTGAGAIYWHVASKDELLAGAASDVITRAIRDSPTDPDPREEIRSLALSLFDAFDVHPWVGWELAREFWRFGNAQILEAVGSRLPPLGVPSSQQFDAASTLLNYISGAASQNAGHARTIPMDMDRATYLRLTAERWEQLDSSRYPFLRGVIAELAHHDDRSQFIVGMDYLLDGIVARR